ncbi:hypothetical protein GTP91_01635 [Rugamonas sp. FT82W]|uniref:MchC protein n=1 Tax=Duganella vulcania TaxID=2692166 RepID=A0A845FXL7_9BURK|nr:hypothetical protein [Duganella vulcania]MYM85875.1 hypothetical protein [Duganella vulcania]
MTAALLPPSSQVGVQTRRLKRAEFIWLDSTPQAEALDAGQVFCCPQAYEEDGLYSNDIRTEWADKYGGSGVGAAGGSGRCSTFNGIQTKGVGTTPLVAPFADPLHSSGTVTLFEAATEALFAGVYQASLPFGAVPVHAVILTGGRHAPALGTDAAAPCIRSLVIRPFVPRPAHFMRNLRNPDGMRIAGPDAPGMTLDASRTEQAMACLGKNLKTSLGLSDSENDELALLDAGLRELNRRLAWQSAASFAKRLPHGSLSCSNISLSGAYLDFGIAGFVPSYRRLCRAHGQEPWTESAWPLKTLLSLRQQLDKYRTGVRGRGVVSCDDLGKEYSLHFQHRLAVELAKMAGLTEDMASACPPELLKSWLKTMRDIWTCGARERFVTDAGQISGNAPPPPPRQTGRFDLNAIFAKAGGCAEAHSMDRALMTLLDDPFLRRAYVNSASQIRAWLRQHCGQAPATNIDIYLGSQALRKNTIIAGLQREKSAGLDVIQPFRRLEICGDTAAIAPSIKHTLAQARHVLADLDPELPGRTGIEQMACAGEHAVFKAGGQ